MKNGALVDDAGSHDDDPNKIHQVMHRKAKKKLDIIIRLNFLYKEKNKICFANNKHKNVRYIYYVLQLDLLI
jgi:hypothetical protein